MTSLIARRQLLVGSGALLIAGGAFAAEPRRDVADFSRTPLDTLVPLRAGEWVGAVDPNLVPERIDASVDHGQTISRSYQGGGAQPVMLVVSYHGPRSPDLKVHRPETCYAVAGFEGGVPSPIQAPLSRHASVPAVAFTARRAERVETVLYWTRVGDRFPQTLRGQRTDFLLEALRGVRADGLLMRASLIGADPQEGLRTLKAFAAALVDASSAQARILLLGPQAARAV